VVKSDLFYFLCSAVLPEKYKQLVLRLHKVLTECVFLPYSRFVTSQQIVLHVNLIFVTRMNYVYDMR
jgi:hypothetical protein